MLFSTCRIYIYAELSTVHRRLTDCRRIFPSCWSERRREKNYAPWRNYNLESCSFYNNTINAVTNIVDRIQSWNQNISRLPWLDQSNTLTLLTTCKLALTSGDEMSLGKGGHVFYHMGVHDQRFGGDRRCAFRLCLGPTYFYPFLIRFLIQRQYIRPRA